jgi:hypothetical protein
MEKTDYRYLHEQSPGQQFSQVFVENFLLAHGYHKVVGLFHQLAAILLALADCMAPPRIRLFEYRLIHKPRVQGVQKMYEKQQCGEHEFYHMRPVNKSDVHRNYNYLFFPLNSNVPLKFPR